MNSIKHHEPYEQAVCDKNNDDSLPGEMAASIAGEEGDKLTNQPPVRSKSRGISEADILERFDRMVGPLPLDVRKALYLQISSAIAEELIESGCAFLPTLGWLTVNIIPKDDDRVFVRPSFKASRDLKDEIKTRLAESKKNSE